MLLTLSGLNEISRLVLPEKVSGRYSVEYKYSENKSDVVLMVEEDGENWKILCSSGSEIIIEGSPVKSYRVEKDYISIPLYLKRTGELLSLVIEQLSRQNMVFRKLVMNKDGAFTIGTDKRLDICINDRSNKGYVVQIEFSASKGFYVSKFTSNGGIYRNFKKIEYGFLNAGDLLLIGSFRFVFGKNYIAYDRFEQVDINNSSLFSGFIPPKPEKEIEYYFDEEYAHSLFFCSPRLKKELVPEVVSVEYPPQSGMNNSTPIAFTLGPSITMGLSSAVTAGFTVTNQLSNGGSLTTVMPSVIMASSMLLSSILWPVVTRTYERRKKRSDEKKRKVKYIKYLRDKEQLIDQLIDLQRQIINENNPSLENLVERVKTRDRTLWERMYGQSDFLSLCAGIGSVHSLITISGEKDKFTLDEDILRKEADKLLSKSLEIENVPVEMSLADCRVVGVIGERNRTLNFMKGWIIQLTSLYSYDDLGIVIIYDKDEKFFWESCRWLPHIWNSDKDIRLIASDADELKEIKDCFISHYKQIF